ncbi:MAG: KAP family NTPase, partial [Sneathiella sp.]
MVAQPDRAIRVAEDDELGRSPFIKRLVSALIDKRTKQSTGVVVGIVGEWGSGKSSILNMLDQEIRAEFSDALVVRFDPWLVSGRDDLIQAFLKELISSISPDGELKKNLKALRKIFNRYSDALKVPAELAHPLAGKVIDIVQALFGPKPNLNSLRQELAKILKDIAIPIVVLIDELDRVDDDEVHAVAQLVRAVMDFPSISYVLAYDEKRVAQALGRGAGETTDIQERGRAYLEKIVQFPISLPVSSSSELIALFQTQFDAVTADLEIDNDIFDEDRYKELIEILFSGLLTTPRDIKRVVGMFHVIAGMVGLEVDCVDLLAFTALRAKAPNTATLISDKYYMYTNDGWHPESIVVYLDEENASIEKKRKKRINADERKASVERLMGFLFPVLSNDRRPEVITQRSLCNTRPLITVLRLGLIPGVISSRMVRDLLGKSAAEITGFFQQNFQSSDYAETWQSIWDTYLAEEFSDEEHLNFWSALSDFSRKRDGHWLAKSDQMRNIVGEITDLFRQKFFA